MEKKPWTEERVARLKQLWGTGLTTENIAVTLSTEFPDLPELTRNAVIGKANRLGLAKKHGRQRSSRKKISTQPPSAPATTEVVADELPVTEAPEASAETLAPTPPDPSAPPPGALPWHRRCQFPIGHPGEADFRYCDHETLPGKPYCDYHCGVAYRAGSAVVPPPPREGRVRKGPGMSAKAAASLT